MKQYCNHLVALLFVMLIPVNCPADSKIEAAGDVLYILMPITAYGSTWYLKDKEGAHTVL